MPSEQLIAYRAPSGDFWVPGFEPIDECHSLLLAGFRRKINDAPGGKGGGEGEVGFGDLA